MKKIALGIDIGATNTKLGIVKKSGEILGSASFKTESERGFQSFKKGLCVQIELLLKEAQLKLSDLAGIGFGSPNANGNTGWIQEATNLQWEDVHFLKEFQQQFSLPLFLENDANVAALGEKQFGVAQGYQNFLVITLGTGVGTGLVLNEKLITGTSGIACEGGHIMVEPKGRPCGCGGYGHLEAYASVSGIKKTTKELTGLDLRFREICTLYEDKNSDVIKVLDFTAFKLAQGLAAMGSFVTPELFVLAGGVASLGEDFRSLVEKYYQEEVYPPFKKLSEIKISSISTSKGAILGAASLVFNSL